MDDKKIARVELDRRLQQLDEGHFIQSMRASELLQLQFLREISDELHQINLNTHPARYLERPIKQGR